MTETTKSTGGVGNRLHGLVEFLCVARGRWWRWFPPKCENCGSVLAQDSKLKDVWACPKCWND